MTRHSTNDTELFRKMTSLILMDKISPYGRCRSQHAFEANPIGGFVVHLLWRHMDLQVNTEV